MRDQETMMHLLYTFGAEHECVRAAYLTGSRANPHVQADSYQDYDIVYLVTDLPAFKRDKGWLTYFGEIALMQEPAELDQLMGLTVSEEADFYMFLVLYSDGNRLDIKILAQDARQAHLISDRLLVPLLDKDDLLKEVLACSSDATHWTKRPTAGEYLATCNEFWWCMQNVIKGGARREFTYAYAMLETVVRPCLNQLIFWRLGLTHDFKLNLGKDGKFLGRYLTADEWEDYLQTYSRATLPDLLTSLEVMMTLFSTEAQELGRSLNFPYQAEEEQAIRTYFKQIKKTL